MKKTVIIGSAPNQGKYAQQAARMLKENGYDFVPVGVKEGDVLGEKILNVYEYPHITDVDTVTLYIGADKQKMLYNYIINLQPKRIIFNPGAENNEFKSIAENQGIECLEACTLVMLSIGNF